MESILDRSMFDRTQMKQDVVMSGEALFQDFNVRFLFNKVLGFPELFASNNVRLCRFSYEINEWKFSENLLDRNQCPLRFVCNPAG